MFTAYLTLRTKRTEGEKKKRKERRQVCIQIMNGKRQIRRLRIEDVLFTHSDTNNDSHFNSRAYIRQTKRRSQYVDDKENKIK